MWRLVSNSISDVLTLLVSASCVPGFVAGEAARLFTGVLPNGYGPPPGFCFDILCSDEPIMDDPRLHDYNVDDKVLCWRLLGHVGCLSQVFFFTCSVVPYFFCVVVFVLTPFVFLPGTTFHLIFSLCSLLYTSSCFCLLCKFIISTIPRYDSASSSHMIS